jgi:pyridoxal 5'-phosphate synthase pdxT subunit
MIRTIAVLALQGCVEPHRAHVEAAGARFAAAKTAADIGAADALILPGGESTTMLRLLRAFGLWDALAAAVREKPVWGVCAGAILLAQRALYFSPPFQRGEGWLQQESLGVIPMTAVRNAYGRQVDSHRAEVAGYPVAFIRAPKFKDLGPNVEVLARAGTEPVWVRHRNAMATAFHPELSPDAPSPMHRAFVDML